MRSRRLFKQLCSLIGLFCMVLYWGCATSQKTLLPKSFKPLSEKETKLLLAQKAAMQKELLHMSKSTKNLVFTEEHGKPEYIIGPGDVLEISLWEENRETRHTVTVRADGSVSISFLEDIEVAGYTLKQVDKAITEELVKFVKDTRVDVLVREFKSKKASLFGEINVLETGVSGPGNYPLKGKITVLDLLITGGGATADADLRRAKLLRGGKTYTINLYNVLYRGETSQNVIIDEGDVVIIPESPTTKDKVFVLGEIKAPGAYSFKHEIDLITAISLAGGYTDDAVEENTVIVRGYPNEPQVVVANMKNFLQKGDFSQNISLQSGDVVYLPKSTIGNIHYYISRLIPILDFGLFPAIYRDAYTTGGGLRINTGSPP